MNPKSKRLALFKQYPELESISFRLGRHGRTLRVLKLNELLFFSANKTTKLTSLQKGELVENNIKVITLSSFPHTLSAENYLSSEDLNQLKRINQTNHKSTVVFLSNGDLSFETPTL